MASARQYSDMMLKWADTVSRQRTSIASSPAGRSIALNFRQIIPSSVLQISGSSKDSELSNCFQPTMACERIFVRPSMPVIPGWTKLPPIDQVQNRFILPAVLIFQLDSPALRASVVQDLQAGLASTVGEMPFLAANIVPDDEELGTIQLEISDEDDAGVWFHVQDMPELDYNSLECREFPPAALPLLPLMPEPRVHHDERSPVLTVQATFITGGLLVVFNTHHSALDAIGMSTFCKTWAKHVAAASEGRLIPIKDMLSEEILDRSNAFGVVGRLDLSDFPHYRETKRGFRSAMEQELMDAVIAGDHPKLQITESLDLSQWYISNESLHQLKDMASPPSPGLPVLTENTILCALLWRHVSKARQLSARGIASTSLINVVNIRRRLDPPLPLEYPGNAVVHAKTTATTADVESSCPTMLYTLARQVTDAIEWWTADRLWDLIGALGSCPHARRIEPAMDNFQGADLEITNTGAIGELMQAEWGYGLGKTKALRYAYAPVKEGWINILPQRRSNGIELLFGLEKDVVQRMREDKEWTRFAVEFS